MKTAIVFFSLDGHTRRIALKLAEDLDAAIVALEPVEPYPEKGFRKYVWGGYSAARALKPALRPYIRAFEETQLVILGSPVWNGRLTPPIHTFLAENDLSGKHVAAFACHAGGGAKRLFAALEEKCGALSVRAEFVAPLGKEMHLAPAYGAFVNELKALADVESESV